MQTRPYREAAASRTKLDELHRLAAENPTDEFLIELRKQAIRAGIFSRGTIKQGAKSLWPIGFCEVCGYGPLIQGQDGREVIQHKDLGHVHVCFECEVHAGTITTENYLLYRKWCNEVSTQLRILV